MTYKLSKNRYKQQEAKILMNYWGKENTPFFFVIDFLAQDFYLQTEKDFSNQEVWFDIQGKRNFEQNSLKHDMPFLWEIKPIAFKNYQKSFQQVQQALQRGDTYLLNLTMPTEVITTLSLEQIFLLSQAKYKIFWKDKFVCFSPETFVTIQNNSITSFPMKGTINAEIPEAEILLLHNPKEKAEHYTIVDLIRNDLSQVADNVYVESFRYVEKLQSHRNTLLQVSSKIVGVLPENYSSFIGDILLKILPAGSISGAPKRKTVAIIQESEPYTRGFYTGIFGYFDGTNLDSAVMIRFIEKIENKYYFKSGGGITALSNLEEEYQEMIAKVYVPIY